MEEMTARPPPFLLEAPLRTTTCGTTAAPTLPLPASPLVPIASPSPMPTAVPPRPLLPSHSLLTRLPSLLEAWSIPIARELPPVALRLPLLEDQVLTPMPGATARLRKQPPV